MRRVHQYTRDLVVPTVNVIVALRKPGVRLDPDEVGAVLRAPRQRTVARRRRLPERVLDARVSHNVLINQGRMWVMNSLIPSGFPADGPAGPLGNESLGETYSVLPDPAAVLKKEYKVRFVGVGVGGVHQGQAGAPAGTFTETVDRTGLERPWTISGTVGDGTARWLAQIEPFDDLSSADLFPDYYTRNCRLVLSAGDVSYTGAHDHDEGNGYASDGLIVPISEALLCTSQADPTGIPWEDGVTPVSGAAAYNNFVNINKTPDLELELIWSLIG